MRLHYLLPSIIVRLTVLFGGLKFLTMFIMSLRKSISLKLIRISGNGLLAEAKKIRIGIKQGIVSIA